MGSPDASVVRQLLSPIAWLLQNPALYEVVINRPGEVLAEGPDGWSRYDVAELTFDRLMRLARTVASHSHQAIDEARPILSAILPNDARVQVVIPPATAKGTVSITIRKPSSVSQSISDLDASGLFAVTAAADDRANPQHRKLTELYETGSYATFLRHAVLARKNIIISGATGSGKTTLSKALIQHIPMNERIITIEDTAELVVPQPNHVRLFYSKGEQGLAKIGPKELLESSLRMRPDRVLLQELRDGTAFYYIRNINSGHPGSITTVHAHSPALAFEQLTLLVKESDGGQDLARDDIRDLLKMLVDVVVQCKRVEGKFRVTEIWSSGSAQRPLP